MRRLFLLSPAITLPFMLLIIIAMQIGDWTQSTPSMLRRSCESPCWNGIRPGEMSIDAANQILFSQGYEPQNAGGERITYVPSEKGLCTIRVSFDDAIVTETRLTNCPRLRLGDVLAAWGSPDSILHVDMTLSFNRGMARIRLVSELDCSYELSPYTPVHSIRFGRTPGILPNEVRWHGFMPAWGYKELSPNTIPLEC